MKFQLKAGATADVLNKGELGETLDQYTRHFYQEAARGLSTALIEPQPQPAVTGAVQFPATGETPIGPDTGFIWQVTRLSASGLTGADALQIFRGQGPAGAIVTAGHFVGTLTVGSPVWTPGKGLILRGGQRIAVSGASLTSTADIVLTGEAFECSELDPYKIIR